MKDNFVTDIICVLPFIMTLFFNDPVYNKDYKKSYSDNKGNNDNYNNNTTNNN